MDLPPSGWYPDPYGASDLLRWWDGSTWTHHTHAGVGGGTDADSGVAQTTVGQSAGGGWATRDRVIGDWAGTDWPSGDLLADTKPPKGPRTEPQPALPDNSVQPTTHQPAVPATAYQRPVQPTVYQPAVSSVGAVGATTVQPAAAQPTAVQPGGVAPTAAAPTNGWGTPGQYSGGQFNGGGPGGGDGTQVLFLGGDAWQVPGGPGGPGAPNRYGYQQAQQRRRLWLIGGLVAGTAVAIAIIVVVATSLGGSHGASAADQAATTPPAAPTPTAAAPTPTPTPTPTASASASATLPASMLSDGQSGLSYAQLATPWTPVCPSDLNSAFPWTAGESAIAGQINSGQTAWYGEACSGPLPAQYNYSGVRDLENTATNVTQTLENVYYNALTHTIAPMLSQPVTVSGHPGWEIEYLLNYTNAAAQGATWTTEVGAVVVADTGTGNTPVVFFTSVPDTLGQTNVGALVSSLQLTVVPGANSGSPPADAGGRVAGRGRGEQPLDDSRPDPWAAGVGARELMVSLWYPATPSDGPRARYMTPAESELQLTSRGITGVPPGVLSTVRTNAVYDAEPAGRPRGLPLVVLSPGFTNSRSALTGLAEDLASHGYVVAAIDHTYESFGTEFPDGRVTTGLARETRRRGEGFWEKLLAGRPLHRRRRRHFHPAGRLPHRPFLLLGKESNYTPGSGGAVTTWEQNWGLLTGWKRWLVVAGAIHASFTDLALLADQVGLDVGSGLSGARSLDITRAYLRAFFDLHLRGSPQVLLDAPSARYPEVTFCSTEWLGSVIAHHVSTGARTGGRH